jgi:hypothetical protein
MSIQNRIFKKTADFSFFQIYIDTKTSNILDDFKGVLTADEIKKLDKNKVVRIKNNDSIINVDNWSKLKDVFFSQRMETYNSSYTPNEKIKLELETLKKLPINNTDYKILKERYQKYLTNIEPQQQKNNEPDEVKKELHNNIFKGNAFEIWQSMFEKFKITESKRTDIDFMFEVMKYNNLIYDNIKYVDIQNWINNVYEISFDKIKFTNHKAKSNDKRLIIYNDIISK